MTNLLSRSGAMLALGVCLGLGSGSAVRADNLDKKLVDQAGTILTALEKHGYHNVGILRARVQVGTKADSFKMGPINGNLATRIENALILHLGSEPKLGVIHDASHAAAEAKVGSWYTVPAERKKLFEVNYPLAWGDKKVHASALIAPLVKVTADYTHATIVLEAFSSKEPAKMVHLTDIEITTDTQLLHDLGKSYNVAMRGLKDKSSTNVRKLAIEAVKAREDNTNTTPATSGNSVKAGDIEFKLLSDGTAVEIKGSDIVCPDQGKPVVFSLTNTSADKTLAVDAKLNGMSLFKGQTEAPEQCRVWVIPPGKTFSLKGFYEDAGEKNVAPFKILVGEEAKTVKDQLGEKAGVIQITVFEEDKAQPPTGDVLQISRNLRALKNKEDHAARKDLHTLQNALLKRNLLKREVKVVKEGGKTIKRELIVKDEAAEAAMTEELKVVDFKKSPQAPAALTLKIQPKEGNASTDTEKKNPNTDKKEPNKEGDK